MYMFNLRPLYFSVLQVPSDISGYTHYYHNRQCHAAANRTDGEKSKTWIPNTCSSS